MNQHSETEGSGDVLVDAEDLPSYFHVPGTTTAVTGAGKS